MFSESNSFIRRLIRGLLLPYCFMYLTNWKECIKPAWKVVFDLLHIFFKLKYYPDNYGPCRLWEKERKDWYFYYGSTYNSYPRQRLRKLVQRYEYQVLFNDKELCEYFCSGLNFNMPKFYGVIDSKESYEDIISNIFYQNIELSEIIVKPTLGHAGLGIAMCIREKNKIWVKTSTSKLPLADFELRERCILQEVVKQHKCISEIASSSVNTIRVVTLWAKNGGVVVVSASMRFGQGDSFVDNWSAGGVSVGVDQTNGVLKKIAYDKAGNQFLKHPVSNVTFAGFQLPHWASVLKLAEQVQSACPFYRLIGCDIAICDEGPVLIEVNANPDIIYQEQSSGPILADRKVYDEFAAYGLLINDFQKKLYD